MARFEEETGGRMGGVVGGLTKNFKWAVLGITGLAVLVTGMDGIVSTEKYERNVVTQGGEIVRVTEPGYELKLPFIQSTKGYRTDLQTITVEGLSTTTEDNQTLADVKIEAQYRLSPDNVAYMHENAPDFKARMEEMLISAQKNALGAINTNELAENRGKVEIKMQELLQQYVDSSGLKLTISKVNLADFSWDPEFEKSIQDNMRSKNEAQRAVYQLQEAKTVAEKAQTEALGKANATREAAYGDRDARKARAEGEAFAISAEGKAQAEALEAKVKALGGDADSLVELEKAKKWDGELPQIVSGGDSSSGMFLDLRSGAALDKAKPAPTPGG